MEDTYTLLQRQFGYAFFRPGQEALIDALLAGNDALGIMPTGAGKSICYQLPALLLPGLTVVLSPLIALMKDQVSDLEQAGVPAVFLNSSLDEEAYRQALRKIRSGRCKLLYIAPERLESDSFLRLIPDLNISLIAVDEAHCVSQWGQDFRPSYLKIAEFVKSLPSRPPVGAFTATATREVREDIIKLLELRDPLQIITGFDRPNLKFEVVRPVDKQGWLKGFLSGRPAQSGIVYCATRKTVESVCEALRRSGFPATRYHAGLEDRERQENQEEFVCDQAKIMVATNAFGMGIDKSNVSFVVHYNMPKSLEAYYQEAGRAGRDGMAARCVLLFSAGDVNTAKFLLDHSGENEALSEAERELVRRRDRQRLDQMVAYCKTAKCLRSFLLEYFGETAPDRCGNCGNCTASLEERDITTDAQKILSGVVRVENRYRSGLGVTLIVRMLHGGKDKRVMELGLNELSTYGIMHELGRTQIREYIDFLISQGYLTLSGDQYPVVHTTAKARDILFRGKRVSYTFRKQIEPSRKKTGTAPESGQSVDGAEDLFECLRELRARIAKKENVPAYIVFSNATLSDMAKKQPDSPEEFLRVSGVGEVKANRYGKRFIHTIRMWKEKNT